MNSEIKQISEIVISARKALYDGGDVDFVPTDHVCSVNFIFAPNPFTQMSTVANSVEEWFRICKKRSLADVKMIVPNETNRMHLLGFANTSLAMIMCFWKRGKVSIFCPTWQYDKVNAGWRVIYCESRKKGRTSEKPTFPNRTEEFKQVLSEIGPFADGIEHHWFANVFAGAHEALCAPKTVECNGILAQLPEELRGIYYAADKADVFGAMGSWNDSPPCYAHRKGLDKEYDELSERLLTQVRQNLMYVVNECWKRDLTIA